MIQDAEIKFETDYDWRRMIGIYDALIEKQRAGLFDATAYSTPHVPDLVAHDIGSYGMLFTSQQLTPNEIWYVWNGQLLETVFPWSAKLRQKFGSHGIDLVDFSLSRHFHSIKKHTDKKAPGVATQGHCNLNYIVESDPESTAYFQRPDGLHFYRSPKNTAWLLDSTVPHWVENEGQRIVFQLRFHSPYDQVRECLTQYPIELK